MKILTKRFDFEAAHRLDKGYVGKCRNIHGHSWKGEIHIAFNDLNKYDMGIDFYDVKQFTNIIVDRYDHALLLYEKDQDLIDLCKSHDWEIVTFDANPTSEIIAKSIYEEAVLYFKKHHPHVSVEKVIIEESCTARCIWGKSSL